MEASSALDKPSRHRSHHREPQSTALHIQESYGKDLERCHHHSKKDQRMYGKDAGPESGRPGEDSKPSSRHHQNNNHGRAYASSHNALTAPANALAKHSAQSSMSKSSDYAIAVAAEYFTIDRKGDLQNTLYGSLSEYAVPRYRKVGYGRILGLDGRFRFSPDSKTVEEVVSDPVGRRSKQSLLSKPEAQTTDVSFMARRPREDAVKTQRDYIPVRQRKRRRVAPVGSSDAPSDLNSQDSESTSSGDELEHLSAFDLFRKGRERVVELETATRQTPDHVETWLNLVSHYDEDDELSNVESRSLSLADIKIGVYEKGLTHVKSAEARGTLLLGMLGEGAKVWDTKKLFAKWEAILKETADTDNLDLWLEYIDLYQTSQGMFTVENCIQVQLECLQRAQQLDQSARRDEVCIYILLRSTTLLGQVGFIERAVAIWQAVIEWTLFTPSANGGHRDHELLTSFEKWWNSEAPRFGEQNARGWTRADDILHAVAPRGLPSTQDTASSRDPYEAWSIREQEGARDSQLPARTLDDPGDDPYRVVLFSDIKDFIFTLSSAGGRLMLANAFLIFYNLPPLVESGCQATRTWSIDLFLRNVESLVNIPDLAFDASSTEAGFQVSIRNCAVDTATLFVNSKTCFSPWPTTTSLGMDPNFCFNALHQLSALSLDDDLRLAEYVLGYVLHSHSTQAARKLAKSLLRIHPSSLRLYNAYALILLRSNSNLAVAENVWVTALSSFESQSDDALLCWASWTWSLIECGKFEKAISVVSAAADTDFDLKTLGNKTLDPAATLRTQRQLEAHLPRTGEILSLFTYLTSAPESCLSHANSIFQHTLELLSFDKPTSFSIEHLHQSLARLIDHHVHRTGPITPSDRKLAVSILTTSLSQYPNNTILLTLHHELTKSTQMLDRLRIHTQNLSNGQAKAPRPSTSTSLITSTFSINSELSRPSYGGRTEHTIRATFQRALSISSSSYSSSSTTISPPTPISKHNPSLWHIYLTWELSLPPPLSHSLKPTQKANKHFISIFHASLRACPWSKSLYLLAFSTARLRSAIGTAQLDELYESMLEKGIRIHHELQMA